MIEPASIRTDAGDKVAADAKRVLSQMNDTDRRLYATAYESMTARALAREQHGSDPDVVARVVLRALTARRPRTRYIVGKDAYRLAFVARWVPDRLFDRIRIELFGLPERFGSTDHQAAPVIGALR